jgi:NAD(P)H-flavin reductase
LEVSGPFGKGLEVASDGIHIAFAAGTGVLTFMDLVAQIALFNLDFGRNLGQESFANQIDYDEASPYSKQSINHATDRTEEGKQFLIEDKFDEF